MLELFAFLLFLLLVFLFVYLFDSRVFDEHGRRLPGPAHHLWGKNFWFIINQAKVKKQYSKTIAEIFLPEMGDGNMVAYNWISGGTYIILGHPELAKAVLSGHSMKFRQDHRISRVKDMFCEGLLTCDDNRWPHFRGLVNPLMKSSNLKGLLTVFNIHCRRLIRHWNYKVNKMCLDSPGASVHAYLDLDFRNLMIGVMCEAGFGYDFFTHTNSKIVSDDFETLVNEYNMRFNDPVDWWRFIFPYRARKSTLAMKNMRHLIDSVIAERVKLRNPVGSRDGHLGSGGYEYDGRPWETDSPSVDASNAPESYDLLEILLNENETLSKQHKLSYCEIRDQIITFMILGYEVTASTLMSIFYELCLHPEVQEKCQCQLDEFMISKDVRMQTVLFDDIVQFTELIQVLKETLRLHPPIQTIYRTCTTQCNVGKYMLKAGSHLSISVLSLHKHPDFWYLPQEFYPDRFSSENIHSTIKHPYQYIPFGSGSRGCVGQRFAQIAIISITASLFSNFSFQLPDDIGDAHYEEHCVSSPYNLKVKIFPRPMHSS